MNRADSAPDTPVGRGDARTPRLRADALAARRGDVTLFAGLSFALHAGEALVVTGRNGSGKTTLLRILAGLALPSDGRVLWDGDAVQPFDARLRDAVVFNGHLAALKDELTTHENLAQWAALDAYPTTPDAVADALDSVALTAQHWLPVRVLSQGQRRRVALARLQLARRALWVLDEPLTALDADGVERLQGLLGRHLAAGGLCVAASHPPLPVTPDRLRTLAIDTHAPAGAARPVAVNAG